MMIDNIKILLGITGNEADAVLEIMKEMVEDAIKAYCRITDVPKELNIFIARKVMDNWNKQEKKEIKTITEGDTAISYNVSEKLAEGVIFSESEKEILELWRKKPEMKFI